MYKLLVIGLIFILGFYFIYKSNDIETFTDAGSETIHKDFKIAEKCPDVLIQKGAAFFLYNSKRANVPGINPIRFESLEEYVEFTDWQRSQGILCPVLYLQHAYNAQGEPVYKARPSPTNMLGGQPDYLVTADSLPKYPNIPPNIMPPPANVPIQGLCAQNALLGLSIPESGPHNMPASGPYSMPASGPQSMPMGQPLDANTGINMSNDSYNPNSYSGFDPQNQTIGIITPLDNMYNQTSGVSPNPMDDNWGGVEYTENLVKAGYYKGNEVSKGSVMSMHNA